MSATILPFPNPRCADPADAGSRRAGHPARSVPRKVAGGQSPLQPPAAAGDLHSSIADALSETALAMRIAARKLRARIKPQTPPLQMGEKVLFHWPSGRRNREHLGPQDRKRDRAPALVGGTDCADAQEDRKRLTTGIVTGWVFGAADEADRRYFIQLTDGPDAGTRICHARKGLVTVFPQEDLRRTAPQGQRPPGTFAGTLRRECAARRDPAEPGLRTRGTRTDALACPREGGEHAEEQGK